MAFDWEAYLSLAKELEKQNNEAARRSAISRAYYCAYNYADNYCTKYKLHRPKKGGSHERTWNAFSDQELSQVAIKGNRLRRQRKKADYTSTFRGNLSSECKQAIHGAETIVKTLREMQS